MSADLKSLWQAAKAFALSRKVKPELAEEFAQELVLERALGGKDAYRLDWKLTDFLRKEHGNLRTKVGRARATQTSLDAPVGDSDQLLGETVAAAPAPEDRLADPRFRAPLTHAEERVLDEHLDGVDQVELAALLGVTPSRISQLLGGAKKKLRDAAILDELLDDYLRDPERSRLEVSWL